MQRLLFAMLFVAGIHGTCCSAADGDPDPGFADNGRLVIAPADASLQVYAAAVQRDGKLLLAGSRWYVGSEPFDNQIVLWRLLDDGTPDASFGENGMSQLSFGDLVAEPWALALQEDGRILVAGSAGGFGVFRFAVDGSPDDGFGVGGRVIVDFSDLGYPDSLALAIGHDATGRVVAAGVAYASHNPDMHSMAFLRLLADGSPDPAFGNGGRVIVPIGTPTDPRNAAAAALRVDADGGMVAAGTGDVTPDHLPGFVAIRLRADGSPDPAFGNIGIAGFDPPGDNGGRAFSLTVRDDGLLIAGSCGYNSPDAAFCAVRLHADGSVDDAWGVDGWGRIPVAGGMRGSVQAVLQGDGRLALAGTAALSLPTDFAIGRLTAAGQPDATFGSNGLATVSFDDGDGEDRGCAISVQAGRIVAAGFTAGASGLRALAATRLQNSFVFADGFD